MQDATAAVQPHLENGRHRLSLKADVETSIDGDRARILQVLCNLLTNAAKFTPQGGQIWVTVQVDGGFAVISIADTGIGIAPESLPRVFDMFVQLGDALSREHNGLGIGLSLSRYLVGMHGGTLDATSAGLGKGSEFIVRLPVVHSESEMQQLSG